MDEGCSRSNPPIRIGQNLSLDPVAPSSIIPPNPESKEMRHTLNAHIISAAMRTVPFTRGSR